uniref:Uncharacterized protein n=1 Tax=Micrurus corallinus TaxID=54390 RepID=A0A2D4FSM4_MICCO
MAGVDSDHRLALLKSFFPVPSQSQTASGGRWSSFLFQFKLSQISSFAILWCCNQPATVGEREKKISLNFSPKICSLPDLFQCLEKNYNTNHLKSAFSILTTSRPVAITA